MGNDLDYLNDSGIPMDGVELDSSTAAIANRNGTSPRQQLASTTNSASATSIGESAMNPLISGNNEAIANTSPTLSYCDESKGSGNCSPDYGVAGGGIGSAATASGATNNRQQIDYIEDNIHNTSTHDRDRGQSNHQLSNKIRSFGDLFDDDDLD